MKQSVSPIAIGIAAVVLIGVIFAIYRLTSGSATSGQGNVPADADARVKAQKMGEDYGKNMQNQMQQRYSGGTAQTPQGAPLGR